jgi:hypothetical protein
MLCHGFGYFGGLETFSFRCPGPCETVYHVRRGARPRRFDHASQRFRCRKCGIELQLSILAEILPPSLSKKRAAEYEANLLSDFESCPPDVLPTIEQAAKLRRGG